MGQAQHILGKLAAYLTYADASEVRRYRKHTRVATPRGKLEP